jgi:RNA polymerase sigma-70 factor, ECF subfamily
MTWNPPARPDPARVPSIAMAVEHDAVEHDAVGQGASPGDLERELEAHRRELTGYCYRMLGSGSEAEDAVQETLVRAWKAHDRFEGRSSLRSWLYRIATNVCLDMHRGPQRRARPMDLGPSSTVETAVLAPQPEHMWVKPVADGAVIDLDGDPGAVATARESIRLAFVAALQHLPPKQRAALILCEVLRWPAADAAGLLETSVASVNSALPRARATLATIDPEALDPVADPEHQALLARYVDAFERYDMDALTTLLRDDAVISMPPHDLWLQGADQVVGWMVGPGAGCRGSKLIPLELNGSAGFAHYKPGAPGRLEPWAIQVIEVRDGRISGHHNFLFPELFADLGLPPHLDA